VAGTCGYGEELSSSINAGYFLTSCKVCVRALLRTKFNPLQTNDSQTMEKLTVHFRQHESCYVTVVPALLPVREIYNRNTIEGGERERRR
jgi:hypothetical protein